MTFWEGLQLLARPEFELLERRAAGDGCEHKCRSIPKPLTINATGTPNTHHHSPSGSDVSELQSWRSSFSRATQLPMPGEPMRVSAKHSHYR